MHGQKNILKKTGQEFEYRCTLFAISAYPKLDDKVK
jgi:hypothetical protein